MSALRVQWLTDAGTLQAHVAALDALARDAIEPNVFHESWLLLPALRAFAGEDALRIALVWRDDGTLAAVFPFQWLPRTRLTPARLRLWQHLYCFLNTPLVSRDEPSAAIAALLDAIARGEAAAHCVEFGEVTAEGAFSLALAQALRTRAQWIQQQDYRERALLIIPADRDARPGISAKQQKEMRRKWRRLAQQGELTLSELHVDEDPGAWLDAFLQLEASGWKGRSGSALLSQPRDAEFFRTIARAAHARGRLHMLMLSLDGRTIAMQCDLFADDGGFAFKVAFDEQHAADSPGLQLELRAMERLATRSGFNWMDSCASSDHPMLNRLWRGRRAIADYRLACGHGHARLWITYLRLRRWLRAKLRGDFL